MVEEVSIKFRNSLRFRYERFICVNTNPERVSRRTATASDHAQERVFAHRQHQPFCEVCCRSTAKRQTEAMDDRDQPRRASRRWSQYPFGEALSEDLAAAQDAIAPEAAGDYQELYDPPRERQIGHASPIPATHNCSARWTQANASGRPDRNNGLITFIVRTLYNKPTRHPRLERWSACCMALILPQSKRQTSPKLHQR